MRFDIKFIIVIGIESGKRRLRSTGGSTSNCAAACKSALTRVKSRTQTSLTGDRKRRGTRAGRQARSAAAPFKGAADRRATSAALWRK